MECVVFDLDGTLTVPGGSRVVPGIVEVLAALADRGVELAVATSTTTRVARRVLAELGLDRWFASVAGSAPNEGVAAKDTIVAEALLGLGRLLPDGSVGVAVVGDRAGDVHAADRLGLAAVGVAWGATTPADLRAAGAVAVAREPAELLDVLVGEGHRRPPRDGSTP